MRRPPVPACLRPPPAAGDLLDPLLPLLVRALRSRHAPSVTAALQSLSLLMQSQLEGLQKAAAGEDRCPVPAAACSSCPSCSIAAPTPAVPVHCCPSPAPAAAASADAGKAVTELLKRCPKTSHPIAQDCFKLLGGMLRQCERWQPTTGQLRFLLTWAFGDLEEGAAQRQNAFHLLKVRACC